MSTPKKASWNSTSLIAWFSLAVALLGGVPGIISIKNDLFKTAIEISYDKNNSFLALLASDQKERFDKKVVGFYGIRFVGSGDAPTTVSAIRFYIKVRGEWVEGKQIELQTNYVADKKTPCLIMGNTKDNLVVVNWINFREFYGEYYIERGKVFPFNVAFMFDLPEDDIVSSKKWKFVVTDHLRKQYSTNIDSPEIVSWIGKNTLVFDCHLEKPEDVQELLKNRHLDYNKLQEFLQSKHSSKQP
ncbi:MAG: hypothetical protein ACLQDF_09670 [Desulfomonilia bacterium]